MDSLTTTASWHPAKKFLFRFFFVYFFIYCFPFPIDAFEFTKPVAQPFYKFLDWLIPYSAGKWFHLHATPAFPMFDKMDDSNYGLVFLYLNVVISSVVAIAWSLLDQRDRNYERVISMAQALLTVLPCSIFVWIWFCENFSFAIPGYYCLKAFVVSW